MQLKTGLFCVGSALLLALAVSCGDDEDTNGSGGNGGSTGAGLADQTGESCDSASECYSTIARDDIPGEILCIDRVEGGYCSHYCTDDTECCSVDGECEVGERQVCSPFENSTEQRCFIGCEEGTDFDGDLMTDHEYCQTYYRDFVCRSSGGGSANRKICVPGGGNECTILDDCAAGVTNCCDDGTGVNRCYGTLDAEGRDCLSSPQ